VLLPPNKSITSDDTNNRQTDLESYDKVQCCLVDRGPGVHMVSSFIADFDRIGPRPDFGVVGLGVLAALGEGFNFCDCFRSFDLV
jgi:hypothetical protein